MNRTIFAVALTFGMLSTAAVAQTNEEQQACMNDAFKFCSATIPDRTRTAACMVQHKTQLTPACQAVMAKYAPANEPQTQTATAPTRSVPAIRTSPASMKPMKTATSQRPGKPLNILMR